MKKYFIWCLFVCLLFISSKSHSSEWVQVNNRQFILNNHRFVFVGTNLWYGAYLAAQDKPRLVRELDRLERLGISVIRIMATGEGADTEPWRVVPSLQPQYGVYNDSILRGLDFVLVEMEKRHMKAILCLSNFWQWSGGLAQYLNWSGEGKIPYDDHYTEYTERFYINEEAKNKLANHIRFIVTRNNSITGMRYIDDPTIMTWEISNEPTTYHYTHEFVDWIQKSAQLIKELDPHHLVISGSEEPSFEKVNRFPEIDYATIHVWIQNSGWYDPKRHDQTYPNALKKAFSSIEEHKSIMKKVNKPLVLAEFGLARDDGSFSYYSTTTKRDNFYSVLMDKVYTSAKEESSLAGICFWGWSGEARPRIDGGYWKPGDSLLGDPPHEPQGWYGVYLNDNSTLEIIHTYAEKLKAL